MFRDTAPQIPTTDISLQEVHRRIGQFWSDLSDDPDEALKSTGEHELDFINYQPGNKEE